MAIEKINIKHFLELAKNQLVIDVRSPGEFNHAHIPGAYNLPLFTDEERKIVGTAYKQEGRAIAIKIGLDFFGPKMKKMVEVVESVVSLHSSGNSRSTGSHEQSTDTNKKLPADLKDSGLPTADCLLIYCWRGGMRSAGVAWLMDLYGFPVYTLAGGYKKFRNYVLDTFTLPFKFKILGGYTGSGKTETLKALEKNGELVVDLEGLANHKGSAFGNIGLPPQPGQEMFENILALKLIEAGSKNSEIGGPPTSGFRPQTSEIWLEDESQRIGLVNIPPRLWDTMRISPLYFLNIPFEERLNHIVEEYGQLEKEKVIEAIGRIREKLGGLNAKNAIQMLEEGNTIESFRILLEYYDRFYLKALHNRESLNSLLYTIKCRSVTPENANLLDRQPTYQLQESPGGPEKP